MLVLSGRIAVVVILLLTVGSEVLLLVFNPFGSMQMRPLSGVEMSQTFGDIPCTDSGCFNTYPCNNHFFAPPTTCWFCNIQMASFNRCCTATQPGQVCCLWLIPENLPYNNGNRVLEGAEGSRPCRSASCS